VSLLDQLRNASLSPAERRVADVLLTQPELVSFGTVADLARAAQAGGATVMRLAGKLGFAGFSQLQSAVQSELAVRLRPAAARIRQQTGDDVIESALAAELANVQMTLSGVEPDVLARCVSLLSLSRRVCVLAGDSGVGVAHDFVTQLGMVRADVTMADLGSVALVRSIAWMTSDDVLVAIDTARYEAAIVDAVELAIESGSRVIAISDSHLSPIARSSTCSLRVVDQGAGPFDSYTGVLALTNLLVTAVVRAAGATVIAHLDRLEASWTETSALRHE
jgi:DNA-binding MurR/RpiR family transcriptional regulator